MAFLPLFLWPDGAESELCDLLARQLCFVMCSNLLFSLSAQDVLWKPDHLKFKTHIPQQSSALGYICGRWECGVRVGWGFFSWPLIRQDSSYHLPIIWVFETAIKPWHLQSSSPHITAFSPSDHSLYSRTLWSLPLS